MAKIQGRIPGRLAQLLDITGGSVQVDELLDTEGVSLVYGIDHLVDGETVAIGTFNFDTNPIGASVTTSLDAEVLRAMSVIGINFMTDDATRLNYAALLSADIGGPTDVEDDLLWHSGGTLTTVPTPAGMVVGGQNLAQLVRPAEAKPLPYLMYSKNTITNPPRGQGNLRFVVSTNAFGAGTVRVTANVVVAYRLELGGRIASLVPPGF